MANGFGTKVSGLREVVRALEQSGVEVSDLKQAFSTIAAEGARVMRGFVPTLTGRLSASVRGNKAKGKAVVTAGRASSPYAGPINYGWPKRNISGAQFIARTDEVMEPRVGELITEELTTIIRRHGL